MDESYTGLPTSHLLGSVPAVVDEGKSASNYEVPGANFEAYPQNSGGERGRNYQTLESPSETFEQQPASNWKGVFSIFSYTQYFNVDTDVVTNRIMSALSPIAGNFFSKIDANPDLYGPIWIATTLVFALTAFGNCGTYLMEKRSDSTTSWSFDVNYMNVAAIAIYGYVIVVPLGFYFLLQYLGSSASLIRFWCMWGYSLSILILSCFALLIPVEALRWIIIVLVGAASSCFVGSNLRSYIEGSEVTMIVVSAFLLQMALSVFIKVGTAVVTRGDGRVALGRLGSLCEQIKELIEQGCEVVLVTSGAVGLGRQRLRYRKQSTSSFLDLQKPQDELDGKACAAVGQNTLMALYDTLFTQLDLEASQILMTDSDFMNKEFRNQLSETVKALLSAKVIPIFNENDAVSTIKDPYEDSSGIFWDNDSLAALLAMELEADLLVLLSDVNGLYSCPPSDPNSRIIHTYIPEKHQSEITFGDKSRLGRGGMTAKVNSAVKASKAGIPVIITSGSAPNSILKVLRGERIGTLFHMDAHLWENETVKEEAWAKDNALKDSSQKLQALSSEDKRKILLDIADSLEANKELINHENGTDTATKEDAEYEKSLNSRIADSVRLLAKIMEDPNWVCSGKSIGKREEGHAITFCR